MEFKKHCIEINDKKVSYWEKNTGQKKVLILLHGFPGNHRVVLDMARHLKNFRIIVPDLPACGESEPLAKNHTLKNYAAWLDAFSEKILVTETMLVGYSFGSRVAVEFSARYPKKVKKLILITPVVKIDSMIARLASLEYEIAKKLPAVIRKTWLSNPLYHGISNIIIFKSASKKRRARLINIDAKEITHLNPRANIELFNELLHAPSISEGEKITIKTLILAGDKDEIATVHSIKTLCARFTNFQFKIIKNSGHIVIAERPKKVARIINDWMA